MPSDVRRVTLSATGLTGYQVDYVKNPIWGVISGCDASSCTYSYGGTTTTGIVLADVDPNTSGFQVDLDGGENRLGIGLHKGDEGAGASLYYLTINVQSVPATGKPTISGTAQVGQTLTANTSGISDEDGLDDVNFSYQWVRVNSDSTETDIADATGFTYTLASADADRTIKVRVTFTDDAGNQESLTSAATSAVTQVAALSTDATLRDLTLSGVNFGTFESATISYTARVNNTVTETTVAPTLNHSGASYVIKLGGVTDADGVISLSEGSNVITVEVTAEDGQTTRTYTITVTRLDSESDPISSDATLSGLTLSGIDFGTFASGTTSYGANVAYTVSQTTVSPTVNHSEASYAIKLSGVTDSDGTLSLRVGSNVITIEVTAEDEATTLTYTLTVTRADPPSTDATLKALKVNDFDFGRRSLVIDIGLGVSFGNSVTEATVTPTTNHSGASYVIKVGGVEDDDGVFPLAEGNTYVTIEVTAEDGETTRTYNLGFYRQAPSTDAKLRALTLSGIDFGTFSRYTTSYTAQVANTVTETTVMPTVNDSDASYVIKLGGVTDADGTVSLAVGSNVITVEVTAEDDSTTKTYAVTVARAAGTESPNNAAAGAPTISGTAQVGQTLTASTSSITDSDGLTNATFAYQWLSSDGTSDSDISGATSSAYALVEADEGNTIKVKVSFNDDNGHDESLTSEATAAVAAMPNTPAAGAPTISGTAQVDETLTAGHHGHCRRRRADQHNLHLPVANQQGCGNRWSDRFHVHARGSR